MNSLLVILGATATGKTDLALHLARRLGGRIINADSIQVYRGLDAGSCKPDGGARREIPHELIDVADPGEIFSAGRFAREAVRAIQTARHCGQVPIVAGGTGLYLRALLEGIAPIPERDEQVRARLKARLAASSPEALHDDLMRLDPETAGRLGRRDLHRVVRALEVVELTGVPLSQHLRAARFAPGRFESLKIGLTMERAALYKKVEDRVDRIFEAGIVEEVRSLLAAGLSPDAHALKALGYREVLSYLRGEIDSDGVVALVKRNTRRYARRQLTWFRREPDVRWFEVTGIPGEMEALSAQVAELWRGLPGGGE